MLMVGVLGLGLGGMAGASPFLEKIFKPSLQTLTSRCLGGEEFANVPMPDFNAPKANVDAWGMIITRYKGGTNIKLFDDNKNTVYLITPAGEFADSCNAAAKRLEKRPDPLGTITSVSVFGTVGDPKFTQSWNTAIVFEDAVGKEVGRLKPVVEWKGDPDFWSVSCKGGSCSWYGSNKYVFTVNPQVVEMAKTATKAYVIVSADFGIKKFELSDKLYPSAE